MQWIQCTVIHGQGQHRQLHLMKSISIDRRMQRVVYVITCHNLCTWHTLLQTCSFCQFFVSNFYSNSMHNVNNFEIHENVLKFYALIKLGTIFIRNIKELICLSFFCDQIGEKCHKCRFIFIHYFYAV